MSLENIYPIFDTILSRSDKEKMLKQKSIVIWMVGLSGSGKSTLARALENSLHEEGYLTQLLDGDNMRTGINNNLGFSPEDRTENIRRAAETAKLFMNAGLVTICSFISPTDEIRKMAKEIIGDGYVEVYVDCPVEVCEERDVKGLYAKARKGEIPDFTGVSAPFDAPKNPEVAVDTANQTLEQSHQELVKAIIERIKY
ncbi:adenylyl-sulfate kinase [Marivirga tractuosa]|uniref:Adenylyl-sulfate kinase n=1 Tax=Marivirga tractuosa (strain ATCC 23168 / DSM 4126 / NBRC 15989 / NCIMB 1408 / VKM B-1430 / H-43) TaxID=643867 RepID=E4TMF3_MARTH|nr:adenylyl-sulfate kinase [Marivirga tractuosa]ADR22412.1 adenylylsulfate kinase [Marivirga tractuosa DSM 4126]BDD16917.1 adenylyl-sulfate kinase [Marivirga tractuosa]